jgi:hypothetical protein
MERPPAALAVEEPRRSGRAAGAGAKRGESMRAGERKATRFFVTRWEGRFSKRRIEGDFSATAIHQHEPKSDPFGGIISLIWLII